MPSFTSTAAEAIARRPHSADGRLADQPLQRLPAAGVVHRHFDVRHVAQGRQMLAWRDWVGNTIDVLPSRGQLEQPFSASIDCYMAGDLLYTDCRSDLMQMERSLARISTDNVRDFGFQVFLEGGVDSLSGSRQRGHGGRHESVSILALDMNQPLRMQRSTCRILSFFVPRAMMDAVFPDADALHGRVLGADTPLARMAVAHAVTLHQDCLRGLQANELQGALQANIHLLAAAFGKSARLSGDARAAARAAAFRQVRRHIRANLHRPDLSAESLMGSLQISRASLYRMFEHEGGLATYIRNSRLREAADELARLPALPVMDVAYGLGFTNTSDFARAFKRAYGVTPQDFRMQVRQCARQSRMDMAASASPLPAGS